MIGFGIALCALLIFFIIWYCVPSNIKAMEYRDRLSLKDKNKL